MTDEPAKDDCTCIEPYEVAALLNAHLDAVQQDGYTIAPILRAQPTDALRDDLLRDLSVSVEPADCTGFQWPCRLFRVEPVGPVLSGMDYAHVRGVSALRVVEELPAWQAFGPNGEAVVAFIDRLATLTPEQSRNLAKSARAASRGATWAAAWAALDAAWAASRDATWAATLEAAWAASRDATSDAAWAAAWDASRAEALAATLAATWAAERDAACALIVRDRITPEQFATLTQPFVDAGLGVPR